MEPYFTILAFLSGIRVTSEVSTMIHNLQMVVKERNEVKGWLFIQIKSVEDRTYSEELWHIDIVNLFSIISKVEFAIYWAVEMHLVTNTLVSNVRFGFCQDSVLSKGTVIRQKTSQWLETYLTYRKMTVVIRGQSTSLQRSLVQPSSAASRTSFHHKVRSRDTC